MERMDRIEAVTTTRVTALESVAAAFESWRPYVKSVVTDIKTFVDGIKSELTKLHKSWDPYSKPGILGDHEPASTRPSARAVADGPNGHRGDPYRRETGFGHVFTQTHLPPNGTSDSAPPNFSHVDGYMGRFQGAHHVGSIGSLPKLHFPKFSGDNPRLWISHSEDYFEMYGVDLSVWIKVASMYFTDSAARWLQSMERKVRSGSWSEFCSILPERFGKEQHELLIR
ncbi:hypothetical protein QOZ80_UnG0719760 [Eleusine coracana subsp. coracana]|uniref:Retrotransposon gag domain-containing protein n=1 Tax=Eleusine coracana subsp. coracana TaxID=191504 RepID=A0AAV9FWY2_ELECO|nr:hypothetical protein QOZ80_UnG0719760 [Eleusine coracana subsp. coracana]